MLFKGTWWYLNILRDLIYLKRGQCHVGRAPVNQAARIRGNWSGARPTWPRQREPKHPRWSEIGHVPIQARNFVLMLKFTLLLRIVLPFLFFGLLALENVHCNDRLDTFCFMCFVFFVLLLNSFSSYFFYSFLWCVYLRYDISLYESLKVSFYF